MFDLGRLRGIFPPILTPLTADERVDEASMRSLVNWLLEEGVHGIWALGTTGEFAALDGAQRQAALAATLEAVNGRVPVVANVSDAGTQQAIRHGRIAAREGAQAIALTPPYYYPHAMDEMLAHYRAVRQAIDLPLLVYNIPHTVKVKMEVGTTLTLAQEGTVVGIKDSQNDLQWFRSVCLGARQRGVDFRAFLGTRVLVDAGVVVGAVGAVPGVSNVAPRDCVEAYDATVRGDARAAAQAQERVMAYEALTRAVRGGSSNAANLGAMKAYLKHRGLIAEAILSSPLRSPSAEDEARVVEAMRSLPEPVPARG